MKKFNLRDLELSLISIAAGIFLGFGIAERSPGFTKSWGWALAMCIWVSGLIAGTVHARRLRKIVDKENASA